ncbi:MAG: hypothetical protein CM15mV57_380 [uncultured marine virus]|nr:MAG: hypothetical protein CM15mV57_380 [uncultured marine virus]
MVDPVSAGVIVVAHGFWKVVDWAGKFVTHNVGIYGATEAGKTTLDQQLMTEGYVEPLDERHRTHHKRSGFLSTIRCHQQRLSESGQKECPRP